MRLRLYKQNAGFTLLEVVIALFISAMVFVAGFSFYVSMSQQVESQQQISNFQQVSRSCLEELSTNLRKAGYLLDGHDEYAIIGDSLYVFYRGTNPVDSLLYFLQEYSDSTYQTKVIGRPSGMHVYSLMKQLNSDAPVEYAGGITEVRYTPIGSDAVAITLEVTAETFDETYKDNNGFRTFINTERVALKNTY